MYGLAVLAAFSTYCLITLILMWVFAGMARKCGIKGWKWSLPVPVIMFFLIFEDLLPSILLHDYYCNSGRAGFWVYKSIDEWKQENPGVWETLSPQALPEVHLVKVKTSARNTSDRYYLLPDGTELKAHFTGGNLSTTDLRRSDGAKGYWLNQRFIYLNPVDHDSQPGGVLSWFHVYKRDQLILDREKNEVIAQEIDYFSLVQPFAFASIPFEKKSCFREEDRYTKWLVNGDSFYTLKSKIKHAIEEKL